MSVEQDVNLAAAPDYIELFEIDCTAIVGIGQLFRLTPGHGQIVFGGDSYTPFPIQISGVEQVSEGAPPRPRLDVGNVNKLFGTLAFLYGDIVGVRVVYIRTFAPYLNLPSRISAPVLRYVVGRKINHNKIGMSFELRSPIDKERSYLPKRQMLKRDFPGLGINKMIR